MDLWDNVFDDDREAVNPADARPFFFEREREGERFFFLWDEERRGIPRMKG